MNINYPVAEPYVAPLRLLGISIHPVNREQVHDYIQRVIRASQRALVLNVNIHCMNLAHQNEWLKEFLNQAQMVFCDGDGVRWGLKMVGLQPPPKITYDRWIWELGAFCEQQGFSLFFLGSKPGVAQKAADKMKERFPSLKIAGTHHGYFQKSGPETEEVIKKINDAKPDIIILGFGMPSQEAWLKEHWLRVQAHIFLTGGAVFEYAAGQAKRAPAWMIRFHLEWLFRFLQEPKRLFKRYIWGNPYFMIQVMREKLRKKHGA